LNEFPFSQHFGFEQKEIEMKTLSLLGAAAVLFGIGLAGCQNTAEGAKEDTAQNTQAVQKAADKAADATQQAAQNTGEALGMTPKVKTAITSDSLLNDTRNTIDVDTANGVVHLKGHVVNNDMKKRATEVAEKAVKDANGTEKVSNELTVEAH